MSPIGDQQIPVLDNGRRFVQNGIKLNYAGNTGIKHNDSLLSR